MAMLEDCHRGHRSLVKAYPQARKEDKIFNTTEKLPLYQQRCGLYDFPADSNSSGGQRMYLNLSGNMSNVRDSVSSGRKINDNKSTQLLNCYTSGAECVADLSRVCPSYCPSSSGSNNNSCSRSGNLSRSSCSCSRSGSRSSIIGTPSTMDARNRSGSASSSIIAAQRSRSNLSKY